jgi:CheY-like chemotaxis protein
MPQVLVVDNDEAIRETARFLLEDEGYEVIEAPDGAAALDLLRMSDQPMVVLLDIVMPRLSGVELLQLVGRDERLICHAFVVWTASRVPVPAELLASLDAPLVPKPFDVDELLEVVARAAERLDEAESA